jgi:probable HAF family extracellular repeat protein
MKTNRRTAVVLAGALLAILGTTLQLPAQEQGGKKHHHYKLVDLGTFGGPQSYVNVPPSSYAPVANNRGDVTGWADTSTSDPYPNFCFNLDCFTSPAFMWHAGQLTDLGVLPGGASSASSWISPNGLVAGGSENGQIDPLVTELPEVRAVLWREGAITDLGTLEGGYESVANAVNNQGVVAGWSSNTVSDPFPGVDGGASSGLGYQTRAFVSLNGTMQDLGALGTGTDATAYLVNEKGQVAGDSFTDQALNTTSTCGTNVATQDPFFWDKDKGLIDIGTLGGVCGFASGLNDRGQVVGLSDLAGDQQWHAYAWDQQRKLQDLGTFGGSNSSALTNNDAGHVIGWANLPGDNSIRAFLWRNGKKANLGALHNDPCSLIRVQIRRLTIFPH